MLTAKFKNNSTVDYLSALETEEFWGGSSRRTLAFECAPDAMSVDELNDLLSDEDNTADIELHNSETGAEAIHSGYQLKLKVAIEPVLVHQETPEGAAVYVDRLLFKLGKRTYIEQQLKALGI